ncbi:Gfo/Idh/MocA family protein [Nocardioides caldifontis]|uniref:Gfo/Idh/MocA family protein n=1 Tax=Nocardioides caldifontis TaxID=2588938 RepID=UPI0011DFBE03|nr:Gfo/Idh/MocA family oxidoreductase [Nocardioides caldifontis]
MSATPHGRPLGVAVVGYSFMGKAHSNAWRNVGAFYPSAPAVRQELLVGRDEQAVQEAAGRYGWAGWSTDWRSVLERDDIDVVDVCTPGHLHAEVALAALEAGKHVVVEKPLANTVDEAEQMVKAAQAAEASGVRSMVGFNYRRVPALALARRLVDEGRLGTVREVRLSYLQDWLADPAAPMTWRLRKETAGSGALGDLGSHAVDLLHHLLGERVAQVSGELRTFVPQREGPSGREPVTVDDAAWARLRTTSGAVASLEVSRVATGRKNGLQVEVYGSGGAFRFDLEQLNELWVHTAEDGVGGFTRVLVTEPEHPYLEAWWPPGHILGWDHTFTSQAADFLAAVSEGRSPRPSFEDGLAVQRVLAAVEESDRRGGATIDL